MQTVKSDIEELAIFGAEPAFGEKLYVGRPNVGNREKILERFNDMLDRRWLTNQGPYVQELERRVADIAGVKHCIAMCSGTVSLEIAIRAAALTGEVIVPSFTFIATAHALQWQEITPVFCDIDPVTHNIDPARIEELITPRTSGIIGVHLWGRPADVEALSEIADRNRLKLIFDAAQAFSCSYKGEMIGGFGLAEIFSFHATKFVNCFEGGAVVTNDDELAEKMRLMRNFGFVDYDKVIYIGTNGKMSEVSAAMGLASLESMGEFLSINHRNYRCYQEELANVPGIHLIEYDQSEQNNYQYIVVEVDETETRLNRDHLIEVLHAENILARRYFYPGCHNMEPYRAFFPHAHYLLPETDNLASRVLLLPTGTAVEPEDIRMICEVIEVAVQHGEEIFRKLSR